MEEGCEFWKELEEPNGRGRPEEEGGDIGERGNFRIRPCIKRGPWQKAGRVASDPTVDSIRGRESGPGEK